MDLTLKQRVEDFLVAHDLIGRDQESHFVVAYSGGRDSTALLHSLIEIKNDNQYRLALTAAYYWHPWRPLQEDFQIVHQNCKNLSVPWVSLTPNLNLPKTEADARTDRYHQLAQLCHDLGATAVLTAHHQDDQVETILFRILRGTGLEGLTGIQEFRLLPFDSDRTVKLARPMIETPRSEVQAHIEAAKLPYVDDPTNLDTRLKRNFLRHEILPKLEERFPQCRQSLVRLAQITEGELEILQTKLDEVWQDVYDPATESLDEVRFSQLAQPFQRRILRRFLEGAGLELGYKRIDEIIEFLSGKNRNVNTSSLLSLSTNLFLSIYKNRITFESPEESNISPISVPVPGSVSHRELKATITITPLSAEERLKPINYNALTNDEVYVDLSRIEGKELTLRTRQKGDRIKPLGMGTPMKLKRFFINRSIPRFKRDSILLLTTDSEVLWAVGVGLSENIRVKDRPTHHITLTRG